MTQITRIINPQSDAILWELFNYKQSDNDTITTREKKTESSTILVQSMSVIVCDFMQMRNFWTDNDCDNEIIGK